VHVLLLPVQLQAIQLKGLVLSCVVLCWAELVLWLWPVFQEAGRCGAGSSMGGICCPASSPMALYSSRALAESGMLVGARQGIRHCLLKPGVTRCGLLCA
jgi:hypothetical protein